MGQYFNWVNFDKREYIDTAPWPNGQKLVECTYLGCEETDAALTMLAGEWAGDLVAFMGDYCHFENETHPGRREVELRLGGMIFDDFLFDTCTDICGRFDYVGNHPEARRYVEHGDDYSMEPYEGPFDIAIHSYRYIVNVSKREFVDRFRTAVRYIDGSTGRIVRYDPFPQLMCSETNGLEYPDEINGLWFGDIVRPTDEHPGSGYRAVAQDYSYWAPPSITCPDEEIQRVIAEHGLSIADRDILEQVDSYLR